MTTKIADAILRLLNAGADPKDIRVLTDAIGDVEFIPAEDLQQSQAVH